MVSKQSVLAINVFDVG